MTVSTKIRFTLLASALALAAAAPAAFADSGKVVGNIHTDPGGTPDSGAASHTLDVMNKKITPSSVAPDTGTWAGNIHTDPGFTPDGGAASHTRQVMERKVAPSNMRGAEQLPKAAY
jgi:hypothetical protein